MWLIDCYSYLERAVTHDNPVFVHHEVVGEDMLCVPQQIGGLALAFCDE